MGLTAEEARKITEENAKVVDISSWLRAIDDLIRAAATMGETHISDPFNYVRMPCSYDQKARTIQHYVSAGFRWFAFQQMLSWNRPEET